METWQIQSLLMTIFYNSPGNIFPNVKSAAAKDVAEYLSLASERDYPSGHIIENVRKSLIEGWGIRTGIANRIEEFIRDELLESEWYNAPVDGCGCRRCQLYRDRR